MAPRAALTLYAALAFPADALEPSWTRGSRKTLDRKFQGSIMYLETAYGGPAAFWDQVKGTSTDAISEWDQNVIRRDNHAEEHDLSTANDDEVKPDSMVQLLQYLKATPGQKFYDLGSGRGKNVAIASKLFGMNASGIELSKDRNEMGCKALSKLHQPKQEGAARLVHGSIFDYDLADADIIFVNSRHFTPSMLQRLKRNTKGMKHGAYLVTQKRIWSSNLKVADHFSMTDGAGKEPWLVMMATSHFEPSKTLGTTYNAIESCQMI